MKYLIPLFLSFACHAQVTIPTEVGRQIVADLERADLERLLIEKQDSQIFHLTAAHKADSLAWVECQKEIKQDSAILADARKTASNVSKIHGIEMKDAKKKGFTRGILTGALAVFGLWMVSK